MLSPLCAYALVRARCNGYDSNSEKQMWHIYTLRREFRRYCNPCATVLTLCVEPLDLDILISHEAVVGNKRPSVKFSDVMERYKKRHMPQFDT